MLSEAIDLACSTAIDWPDGSAIADSQLHSELPVASVERSN